MILCASCGEQKECLQKEIEGREYDICAGCWLQLEQKLPVSAGKCKETKRESTILGELVNSCWRSFRHLRSRNGRWWQL
jgi:hypothetical protein